MTKVRNLTRQRMREDVGVSLYLAKGEHTNWSGDAQKLADAIAGCDFNSCNGGQLDEFMLVLGYSMIRVAEESIRRRAEKSRKSRTTRKLKQEVDAPQQSFSLPEGHPHDLAYRTAGR